MNALRLPIKMVQCRSVIFCDMIWPGSIAAIQYDQDTGRLTILFESLRKIVFYEVEAELATLLFDSSAPDAVFKMHIFGQYAWTEIGALPAARDQFVDL